jgi:putative ABC transport system permease protein
MVVRQGLLLGVVGIAIGAAGALWLTHFMQALIFDVDPLDLATFAMMGAVLFAITLIACYVPALRATKLDPLVALRYE